MREIQFQKVTLNFNEKEYEIKRFLFKFIVIVFTFTLSIMKYQIYQKKFILIRHLIIFIMKINS